MNPAGRPHLSRFGFRLIRHIRIWIRVTRTCYYTYYNIILALQQHAARDAHWRHTDNREHLWPTSVVYVCRTRSSSIRHLLPHARPNLSPVLGLRPYTPRLRSHHRDRLYRAIFFFLSIDFHRKLFHTEENLEQNRFLASMEKNEQFREFFKDS